MKESKRRIIEIGDGLEPDKRRIFIRSSQIDQISTGGTHFMILSDKKIYTCGKGKVGQLGFGESVIQITKPKQLSIGDDNTNAQFVRCGPIQSGAISESGQLYLWGCLSTGPTFFPTPQVLPANRQVLSVDFGPSCITILLKKQLNEKNDVKNFGDETEVWVWGSALKGQLGLGDKNHVEHPTEIVQLRNKGVCMIRAGETHMAALTKSGEIYLWGDNENNILGLGQDKNTTIPLKLDIPSYFLTSVVCGFRHTLALTNNHQIVAWGYASHGVLGTGNETLLSEPTLITEYVSESGTCLEGVRIQKVTSGGMHSVALSDDGRIFTWGSGRHHKTCFTNENDILKPTSVSFIEPRGAIDIACTSSSTIVIQGFPKLTISIKDIKIEIEITINTTNQALYEQLQNVESLKNQEYIIVLSTGEEVPRNHEKFIGFLKLLKKSRLFVITYDYNLWKENIYKPLGLENDDSNNNNNVISYSNDDISLQSLIYSFIFPSSQMKSKIEESAILFFKNYKLCTNIAPIELLHCFFDEYFETGIINKLKLRKSAKKVSKFIKFRILKILLLWMNYDSSSFTISLDSNYIFIASLNHFLSYEAESLFPSLVDEIRLQIQTFKKPSICNNNSNSNNNNMDNNSMGLKFPFNFPFHKSSDPIQINVLIRLIKDSYSQLAQQLTLIDHWLLSCISDEEILLFIKTNQEQNRSSFDSLKENVIDHSNWPVISQIIHRIFCVRNWVITQVLCCSSLDRLRIFELFRDTGSYLYNDLCNFQSFYSIYLAFISPAFKHIFSGDDLNFVEQEIYKFKQMIERHDDHFSQFYQQKKPSIPLILRFFSQFVHVQSNINNNNNKQINHDGDDNNMDKLDDDDKNDTIKSRSCHSVNMKTMIQFNQAFNQFKTIQKLKYPFKIDSVRSYYLLNIHGLPDCILRGISSMNSFNESDHLEPPEDHSYSSLINEINSMYDMLSIFYLTQTGRYFTKLSIQKQKEQIQEWTIKLKETISVEDIEPHPLVILLGSLDNDTQKSSFHFSINFREMFFRSKAFEYCMSSFIENYPSEYEEMAQQFLATCLLPTINSNLLLKVLSGISFSGLSKKSIEILSKVVSAFKNFKFSQHQEGFKQIIRIINALTSKLNLSKSSLLSLSSSDPKVYISRALSILNIGSELMNCYSCTQQILLEQLNYLHSSLRDIESNDFVELIDHMNTIRLSRDLNDHDAASVDSSPMKGTQFIPSNVLDCGIENQQNYDHMASKRIEILSRLREIQDKIAYSKETIKELDCRIQTANTRHAQDISVIEGDIQSEIKELQSLQTPNASQFLEFLQTDHKNAWDELQRDYDNIKAHSDSLEPSLVWTLHVYIDLQISFLSKIREMVSSPNHQLTDAELKNYSDAITKAETTSHSFGEILSVLEQQSQMDFNELVQKVNQKTVLQNEVNQLFSALSTPSK